VFALEIPGDSRELAHTLGICSHFIVQTAALQCDCSRGRYAVAKAVLYGRARATWRMAWRTGARVFGVSLPCTVSVPTARPHTKIDLHRRRLVGRASKSRSTNGGSYGLRALRWRDDLLGIHSQDPTVIAGNVAIGIDILEELSTPTRCLFPWGCGGLALRNCVRDRASSPNLPRVSRPKPENAGPLTASFNAGAREFVRNPRA